MTIKFHVYKSRNARIQNWIVPDGVTQARFEVWGAAGAMASGIHFRNTRAAAGGSGKPAIHFDNNPSNRALGNTYANSAGYAAGTINVSAGTRFSIAVGQNGKPGFSRIHPDGVIRTGDFVGGAGGWPDGGNGGRGWLASKNLYNDTSNHVTYTTTGALPVTATVGDTWLRTDTNIVSRCTTTYTTGGASSAKWTQKTRTHNPVAGHSGGGGGGSTSIMNDDEMSNVTTRILIAGGSGGAGGLQCANGVGAWQVAVSPTDGTAQQPPFGLQNQQHHPTNKETVWLSIVDYFTSGMGIGGLGGGTSPHSSLSNNVDAQQPAGSWASGGAPGGPATTLHVYGASQAVTNASKTGGGGGGTGQSAGRPGVTAYSKPTTAAQQGDTVVNPLADLGGFTFTNGSGGNGADGKPTNGDSNWCCGGGGGGGGFHGGGGGGAGYYGGHNYTTYGGGGGGGSNFAANVFTNVVLLGGARPPAAAPHKPGSDGTGGLGGFARITYHQPPVVSWSLYPSAFDVSIPLYTQFRFISTGADVYSFDIGYSVNLNATVPDTYTTVLVSSDAPVVDGYSRHGTTYLFYNFAANTFTAGTPIKLFVRCLDQDGKPGSADPVRGTGNGDLSKWAISETMQPVSHATLAPSTVTTPAPGATVPPGTIPLAWTVGTQTPLVGYRAILTGPDGKRVGDTGYRFGGTRINLATNPGFATGGAAWTVSGTVAGTFVNGDTTYPGVSGANGKITWAANDDGSANVISPLFSNKEPGRSYRVMLSVASNIANDPETSYIAVLDSQKRIVREEPISLASVAAGTYVSADFHFTLPNNLTSFYVALLSADSTHTKGNSDSARITYLKDFLVEPGMVVDVGTYFDGGHANGNTGTASWVGATNASASLLTGADITSDATSLVENAVVNGCTLTFYSLSSLGAQDGFSASTAQTLSINQTQPATPSVALVVDNQNGYMSFTITDPVGTYPAVSFNVWRTDVASGTVTRVGTNIEVNANHVGYFQDVPASGQAVTYQVDAVSAGGGVTSTTSGTVTTMS